MILKSVHITEYKSIRDSNSFELGEITCLVGKNESGKTAVLEALYRLNPIRSNEGDFDVTDDYPRSDVFSYKASVASGTRNPAIVVHATYTLEEKDLNPIYEVFGAEALRQPTMTLSKGYENQLYVDVPVSGRALSHLLSNAQLPPEEKKKLSECSDAKQALVVLEETAKAEDETAKVEEETEETAKERTRLTSILLAIEKKDISIYIYSTFLASRVPKFLYFDQYYQMRGRENIEALKRRVAEKKLKSSDYPMLGLIEMASLDLNDLLNPARTQTLKNELQGAGNHLGKLILKYWSQNKHLEIRFDVRPALPEDPEGMTEGTNIWADIYDKRHLVDTNIGTRSRGFVWFFSFLAWYSQLKAKQENLILLLDEPGLSLHGKAQGDLLNYFEEEVKGVHQLIYTTHSPFMVDPHHFERVRIVQDKGIDLLAELPPEEDGTKVLTDVLEASADSLFPLQGALGYEIHQTLFVGPNSVIVEGSSDLLYIQTISALLHEKGRTSLSPKWTITPVGGSGKVPTFVALLGAQKGLNIATLIDFQNLDQQTIENLYTKKLLKKKKVLTFADFTGTAEADIEDMFEVDFYLQIVNEEFRSVLKNPIQEAHLNALPRITKRLEAYFDSNPMKKKTSFNHFRPARYLSENIGSLASAISEDSLNRFEQAFKGLNALLKRS